MTARGRTALALFIFFHGLYALTSSGNPFRIPDEFSVYFQTEHLFDAGDISVPQTLEIQEPVIVDGKVVGNRSVFFGKMGLDGKPYAPWGPLSAVLALPHHAAGRALAALFGIPRLPLQQGLAWTFVVAGVTMLASATAAALAVAGFYRAAIALGTPLQPALWLSLLLGGATVLWPYGTSFYTEGWQAAVLIWAAALLLEARGGASPGWRIAVAAALMAVNGLIKVTGLVAAPALIMAVLADTSVTMTRRVRVAAALSAGIAIAALTHLWWNYHRFGAIGDFGYQWTEFIPVSPPRMFLLSDMPRGIAMLLATPGKSVLLWAPVLALAALSGTRVWRRDRAIAAGAAAAFGISLLFYGAYIMPDGGYTHGPRHFVPIVPWLALLAAGPDADRWPRAVWVACAAIGAVMAVLAVSVSAMEDQGLRRDERGQVVEGYYELIEPAPGRSNLQYRFSYIPFVTAMGSPGWSESPALGQGPNFFPRYLNQARQALPDGRSIPAGVTWGWPALWTVVMIAGVLLYRREGEKELQESR